jgi:hypothetical protein
MANKESSGWHKLIEGYPWFKSDGCYPISAYSEFIPSPLMGRKPLGETDRILFSDDDLFGWHITEIEEEYELLSGIEHSGHQIMNSLFKPGKGLPEHLIHGHGGENLKDNPYSSIFNTDRQIFSDIGVPVVLFIENYDIKRNVHHDSKDTLENIDLD